MARRVTGGLVLLSVAGCGVVAVARTGQVTPVPANKPAARVAAARALQKVVLPPGARPIDVARWGGAANGAPASLNLFNVYRDWRVPGDPRALFSWIKAHPPTGSKISTWGSNGQWGRTVSWDVTFALPPVPGRVYQEGLGIEVSAAKAGGSAVRADGWAIWLIPRPAWEHVPSGIHGVSVFADVIAKRNFLITTVTAPKNVARLLGYINSLQIVQAIARSCPSYGPGGVLLALRFGTASSGETPVQIAEDGCGGLRFSAGKRVGPALIEEPDLGTELWRLGVLPVCAPRQLRASASLPVRLPALDMSLISFRNGSGSVCSLGGLARLQLLDTRGRPVPTHLTSVPNTADGAVLMPGQSATIEIDWPLSGPGCSGPRVASVDVSLPRVSRPIRVTVGSAAHPFAPCNGRIRVGTIARS